MTKCTVSHTDTVVHKTVHNQRKHKTVKIIQVMSNHRLFPHTARVGLCVCLCVCVGHKAKLCKNGSTDRDVVREAEEGGFKEPCIRWGRDPHGKRHF